MGTSMGGEEGGGGGQGPNRHMGKGKEKNSATIGL